MAASSTVTVTKSPSHSLRHSRAADQRMKQGQLSKATRWRWSWATRATERRWCWFCEAKTSEWWGDEGTGWWQQNREALMDSLKQPWRDKQRRGWLLAGTVMKKAWSWKMVMAVSGREEMEGRWWVSALKKKNKKGDYTEGDGRNFFCPLFGHTPSNIYQEKSALII